MTRVMAGLTAAGRGPIASPFEIESSSRVAEDLDFATSIAKTGSVSAAFECEIATSTTANSSGKTAYEKRTADFALTTCFTEEDLGADLAGAVALKLLREIYRLTLIENDSEINQSDGREL